MVIDVHCHVGFSARPADARLPRFSFEPHGAAACPGLDSYFSPRVMRRWRRPARFGLLRRRLGIDLRAAPGAALDSQIDAFNQRHFTGAAGVDRLVLLAFDEYHDDAGRPRGPVRRRAQRGSDLFVSNTLVRAMVAPRPDRYLLGASLHPYRAGAAAALEELKAAGSVLIKWLPVHQNIRAGDTRTRAFLERAASLRLALLVHYGGEFTLARQHPAFEHPGEMLDVLRQLHRRGCMPTTVIAHAATPTTPLQPAGGFRLLLRALRRDFRAAPLYADVSALATPGRLPWLAYLARRGDLHGKLVWGSDFPIPPVPPACLLGPCRRARRLRRIASWIQRDLEMKCAAGLPEEVFHRGGEILDLPRR